MFRAGALVRMVRLLVVLPRLSGGYGGRAGSVLRGGRLLLRGCCLRGRASVAGGGGRTGLCRARRAGRRGAGAVLGVRAVLREVVEQGLLDGAPVAVVVAGAVKIGQ